MGSLTSPSSTSPSSRVALGIDPGTAIVGYAVVEAQGSELNMVACDVITTPSTMSMPERLQHIYHRLNEIITNVSSKRICNGRTLLRKECSYSPDSRTGTWSGNVGIGKWRSCSF